MDELSYLLSRESGNRAPASPLVNEPAAANCLTACRRREVALAATLAKEDALRGRRTILFLAPFDPHPSLRLTCTARKASPSAGHSHEIPVAATGTRYDFFGKSRISETNLSEGVGAASAQVEPLFRLQHDNRTAIVAAKGQTSNVVKVKRRRLLR
jgi:hypothetical protein